MRTGNAMLSLNVTGVILLPTRRILTHFKDLDKERTNSTSHQHNKKENRFRLFLYYTESYSRCADSLSAVLRVMSMDDSAPNENLSH